MVSRSTLNLIWNIIVCILHYVNLVTDFLTLREYWMEGFSRYFWVLAGSATLSWLLIIPSLKYLPYSKTVLGLLWLSHLDYAAWVFIDKSPTAVDVNTGNDTSNPTGPETETAMEREFAERKAIMLIFQSVPSLLVTIHSVFVGNITQFVPQVSLFFSIIDLSFNNAWLKDQLFQKKADRKSISKMSWKFMKQTIQMVFLFSFSNISFYLIWGIMAAITRPWGAWISIPALILIMTLLWKTKFKLRVACLLGFLGLAFGVSPIMHVSAKLVCKFIMVFVISLRTDELKAFLNEDPLWSYYFWISIINMQLAWIYTCYIRNQQKKAIKPTKRERRENLPINFDAPSITVPLISDSPSTVFEEKQIDQGKKNREVIEVEENESAPEIKKEEQQVVQEVIAKENS